MSNNYIPTLYQQYIYKSRYSRWLWDKNRRETWEETVARYFNFFEEHLKENHNYNVPKELRKELEDAVLSLQVMPSMRCLMTAGEALKRDHIAGFNCAYRAINSPRAFDEIHYILLNGTGVGFSVEQKDIDQLPTVAEEFHETDTTIIVADSKLGWAKALKELIHLLYSGQIPKFDVSKVRPAGAPLKTFGGRASGPEPLLDLFRFCIAKFKGAAGRKLKSTECHDIVCKIAETVVVGGVRRCLYSDAPVQTTKGFQPIKNIKVGDYIVTGGQSYRVLEQVYSGKQPLLNIKHRFGVMECTENHEVAVFDSIGNYIFKPAKDIKVGDRLVWDTAGVDGEIQSLPGKLTEYTHFNDNSYFIPETLTDELAWLFGYIHGDGSIQPKGIEISGNIEDQEPLQKAERIFREQFGVSGVIAPDFKKGKGCRLRINSVRLAEWFGKYIKSSHTDITIPDFIIQSTRSNRGAYLAGLFDADGRIGLDSKIDQCTTIYPNFTKSLVSLLSTLGIAAKIYFKDQTIRRNSGVKCKDFYTVRIVGNMNRMNWKNMSSQFSSKKFQNIKECLFQSPVDFTWSADQALAAGVGHRNRRSTTITVGTNDEIYQPVEVEEISLNPELVDTYDIEVETVHQFTTNGIVVHNSALISLSDLNDDQMRVAKSGQWWIEQVQRALANNSAVYKQKPDIGIFMDEWKALYDSKSGERGIFNRYAAKKHIEEHGRRDPNFDFGVNPCLTGDTIIATLEGPKTFKELADKGDDVLVHAWHPQTKLPVVRWMRRPHKTGTQKVLEIEFDSGLKVKATPNHNFYSFRGKKVQAKNLKIGQSVRAWSMSKHPNGHLRVHGWDADRNFSNHQWVHRMVWENAYGKIPEGMIIHHKDDNPENNDLSNLELMTPIEHNILHYPKRAANGFDGKSYNHKVIAIREAGIEDVYNGCVDDAHTYIILDPNPVSGIMSGIVSANCGEILLRDAGFCNLSEAVIRGSDTEEEIANKIRLASILGTWQSTLTNYRYISKKWKENSEEERLLGVSLTGIMDSELTNGKKSGLEDRLQRWRMLAIQTNKEHAKKIGINESVAVTCIKPSGTVSQLTDSSSGIHARHSPYYIRTVRADKKDPLAIMMKDMGFPVEDDVTKPDSTYVFSFPIKSPENAVFRNDMTAVEQLELWLKYKKNWTEHNPSITVSVREHEWLEVGAWVYKNFDDMTGVSFLPYSDHVYRQAPYQDCSKEEYEALLAKMPKNIDWDLLSKYELSDATTGSQELSCVAGGCEI